VREGPPRVHVRWIELVGFRGHASLTFAPEPGLNVLVGKNGQGKTSLLEALHVLLTGRSFRTAKLVDCLGWDAGGRATLAGELATGSQVREVRLELQARDGGVDVRGTLCPWAGAVSFAASDLALLTGGPQLRRAYLDGAAARLVPAHAETCRRYRLVLQQRTRLLADLAGRPDGAQLLAPWDEQLATLGSELVHRRVETLALVADAAREVQAVLAPEAAGVTLSYEPTVPPGGDRETSQRALLSALVASRPGDLRRGLTQVGPHRDDVAVRLGRADARIAASRGEQRLLALALRLAVAVVTRRRRGDAPVLLLDDVLSELDREVGARVLAWLGCQEQVIFTATDAQPGATQVGTVWEVAAGRLDPSPAPAREVA
jgi:DNA replication and repair protein RecF